ncbi:MAG: hypothetical protein WC451_04560 [Patescibacteria group bacterium]
MSRNLPILFRAGQVAGMKIIMPITQIKFPLMNLQNDQPNRNNIPKEIKLEYPGDIPVNILS